MDGAPLAPQLQRLQAELKALRAERDALAARVCDLEQQVWAGQCATAAHPPGGRPGFEAAFRVEQSRAKRQRLALSLVLIEVDDLQAVRDQIGHGAGEDALTHVGRILESALRPTDFVARIEGVTFAALLPATNQAQALAALTRVKSEVVQRPYVIQPHWCALCISAGIVQWRTDEALGDLMSRASRTLGLARSGGPGKLAVG